MGLSARTVKLLLGIALFAVSDGAVAKTPPLELKDIIEIANRCSTVEEFVAALPKEMRTNYSLVHRTRNTIQHASLNEPRVLLSTNEGDILLAFAGAKDKPGSNRVEIIEFERTSAEYRFHTVEFSGGVSAAEEAIRKPPTIRKNETSCFQCHRGTPIWDTYSDWPGTYGFSHSFQYSGERDTRHSAAIDFLESSKGNERYQSLIGLEDAVRNSKLSGKNTELSLRLGRLQRIRLFAQLRKMPNYREIRTALIAALSEHPHFSSLFDLSELEVKTRIAELEADTAEKIIAYDARKLAFSTAAEGRVPSLAVKPEEVAPPIARMRFVFERYGIDPGKMSLGFGLESFSLNEGRNGYEPLLADLVFDATGGNRARRKFAFKSYPAPRVPMIRSFHLLMERPNIWSLVDEIRDPAMRGKTWSLSDCLDLFKKARVR